MVEDLHSQHLRSFSCSFYCTLSYNRTDEVVMINQYNHYKSRSSILVLIYKKANSNNHMRHFWSLSRHCYIVIKLKIKTKVPLNILNTMYSFKKWRELPWCLMLMVHDNSYKFSFWYLRDKPCTLKKLVIFLRHGVLRTLE